MVEQQWLQRHTQRTLDRLGPRLEARLVAQINTQPDAWNDFQRRLESYFPQIFQLYHHLYGGHYDFFFYLEELLVSLGQNWFERPPGLKELDQRREANPDWYQHHQMIGAVCYVDRFAGDLKGICEKVPYFKELGLSYLHLMPLFLAPTGENDGGYAVSSYREIDPALGSMDDLRKLGDRLRQEGISLVVDLVFNHTSDEHRWAQLALAGASDYQEYYYLFPDRRMPDAYEATLREIFPDEHPGAFTYREEIDQWVWTTFHRYQWDLNYANPQVFNRMVEEMLFLANAGVEVLRLDAVAFIWKQMGTSCENLPEAHLLIQAFNACARIAAPALLFKSEAIVHPDEVVRYISLAECQLSYNPLVMALLWNTLATRDVGLLKQAMQERFHIQESCAWVNYVRCHDDIGWTFSDEDANRLGINGYDHRRFLNAFFTGRFPGSFARGLPFQENPRTGDARISGSTASLAGLEKALYEETEAEVDLAIRRILLIHGVILTLPGIPLLYLGDEIGTLNDYSYRDDPDIADDSRWVHRPQIDWSKMSLRKEDGTIEGRIFQGLQRLIGLRKSFPVFGKGDFEVLESGNSNVLGYLRILGAQRVFVLANFSEQAQTIPANLLRIGLLDYDTINLSSGQSLARQDYTLPPFELAVIAGSEVAALSDMEKTPG